MKQAYKNINLRGETLTLIHFINSLITSYQSQGFTLSVRQLYYQLVARAMIENTEKSYKRIASIINDGRLAGLIDWDAIEDRNRDIVVRPSWESGASIVDSAAHSFHMDLWDNQRSRVFIIVEKAALAGVLERTCRKFDVPLLAARGYPSVSIVREMALEHIEPALDHGQRVLVLHLGDHDPSGIDMTRDLQERFNLFLNEPEDFEVRRIALNMEQVEELKPPPNPAKVTDSRFDEYQRNFGDESWELDAINPQDLVTLVEGEIEMEIDEERLDSRTEEIETVRGHLVKAAKDFRQMGV